MASIDERTKTIEKQTRPQTTWQKIKDYVFGGVVQWIIALLLGFILAIILFYFGLPPFSL